MVCGLPPYIPSLGTPLLEIDFYGTDGLIETANERLENFGVSSFEDLTKMPPDVLGRMIWGD